MGVLKAKLGAVTVSAPCIGCAGAITSFEGTRESKELGCIAHLRDVDGATREVYHRLLRCAGCGAGALVVFWNQQPDTAHILGFYPGAIDRAPLPSAVAADLRTELQEAELCASVGAFRAASALLRSTLEKTLKAHGYTKGTLADKIDEAAADGVILETRRKKAHEDIRSLGNDILHDTWRVVTHEEYAIAHHYTQRVLEDFYDDRPTVVATLKAKGRTLA